MSDKESIENDGDGVMGLPSSPEDMVWEAAVSIAAGMSAAIPHQVFQGEVRLLKTHLECIPAIAHVVAEKLVMLHVAWACGKEDIIKEFEEMCYDDTSERCREMSIGLLKARVKEDNP